MRSQHPAGRIFYTVVSAGPISEELDRAGFRACAVGSITFKRR